MVEIHDPNDEVPEEGETVRHDGHYKSGIANVPKEAVPEEDWEYEPSYEGEVVDRIYDSGSILINIEITETENPDFLSVGDVVRIDERIINDDEYYTVEES